MRGGFVVALVVGVALVSVSPAGAGSRGAPVSDSSMLVTATPHTAGARGVRLTLTLRYDMQCNYPGAGPLVVTVPAALKLPHRFAAGTVKLAKKSIAAKIDGRRVTMTIPPPSGSLCDFRGPGSVTLAFTRAAKLANPARPGVYAFRAKHAGRIFTAKLAITPAA